MQGVGEQREHRQSHVKIANLDLAAELPARSRWHLLQALEGFFADR
jgi:hypothetical protein